MSVAQPQPNPETVAALLDTTWRTARAEAVRTDALDRKAATAATFSSVLATLTATLGVRFVERLDATWALALFLLGLLAFLGSVASALRALLPEEYLTLDMASIDRLDEARRSRRPRGSRGAPSLDV